MHMFHDTLVSFAERRVIHMMKEPEYLKWIVEEDAKIINYSNALKCYRIDYNHDSNVLDSWALHIRRHYISDDDLVDDCIQLKMTSEEYLKKYIIPQKTEGMGSTARSNTISEILFSDLMEFIYNYHVPRCRQYNMSGKTVSEHGTDVIGYKFANSDKSPCKNDRLVAVEVKAALSKEDVSVINSAIKDSEKDEYRVALTLNYMRKKLKMMGKEEAAADILRFQQKTKANGDYHIDYVAAGITSLPVVVEKYLSGKKVAVIPDIDGATLAIADDTSIFFVHGKQLMELTHEVYERCVK